MSSLNLDAAPWHLLYLNALPAVDIQRVLNVHERLLAEAMDKSTVRTA